MVIIIVNCGRKFRSFLIIAFSPATFWLRLPRGTLYTSGHTHFTRDQSVQLQLLPENKRFTSRCMRQKQDKCHVGSWKSNFIWDFEHFRVRDISTRLLITSLTCGKRLNRICFFRFSKSFTNFSLEIGFFLSFNWSRLFQRYVLSFYTVFPDCADVECSSCSKHRNNRWHSQIYMLLAWVMNCSLCLVIRR